MSNNTNNDQDLYLRFGGVAPEESGVPLLPPFYAYLLKLSSRVGLVDIYPWLAEVIFYSDVVSERKVQKEGAGDFPEERKDPPETDGSSEPPNVIAFFIDDHKDNIANAMAPDRDGTVDWLDDFARYCHAAWPKEKDVRAKHQPRIFAVDTYGEFHKPKDLNDRLDHGIGLADARSNKSGDSDEQGEEHSLYVRSALAGAGNPARMLQKFSAISRLPKVPAPLKREEELDLGVLNVFVFNSITYLTRTIGFREAMQLIRAILERGVWKPNPPERKEGDPERLRDKNGLLFAVLHEGVHSADEIRYAETFFDGIVRFDAYFPPDDPGQRWIAYAFEQFPLLRDNADPSIFGPDYEYACSYLPLGGRRLLGNSKLKSIRRKDIWPQEIKLEEA